MVGASLELAGRAAAFVKGRPHDFKVVVARQGFQRFLYQLTFPYQAIYTVALGANSVELGLVNSVGMGIGVIASPFTGWLIDRYGIKVIYLIGLDDIRPFTPNLRCGSHLDHRDSRHGAVLAGDEGQRDGA